MHWYFECTFGVRYAYIIICICDMYVQKCAVFQCSPVADRNTRSQEWRTLNDRLFETVDDLDLHSKHASGVVALCKSLLDFIQEQKLASAPKQPTFIVFNFHGFGGCGSLIDEESDGNASHYFACLFHVLCPQNCVTLCFLDAVQTALPRAILHRTYGTE